MAPSSEEESNEMAKKRVELNDPIAIHNRGCDYRDGRYGLSRDRVKALELFHRAAELGYAKAYLSIGYSYDKGEGVEVDEKKALHYYELAAMGGNETARGNLGIKEGATGNLDRAIKHFMIAIKGGDLESLEMIKQMYSNGHATKDVYTIALKVYQEYLGEIKSVQRDEAAAASEVYRYY